MRKLLIGTLAVGAMIVAGMLPNAAQAYWRGGVFFGFAPVPYYYAPPVYYAPPPVVYSPPPVVYDPNPAPSASVPPTSSYAQNTAGSCSAGAYICPLERPLTPGAPCSCPANRGRVAGYAR